MARATKRFDDVPDVVRHRMARVRKKDSKPELMVRSLAHRLGYRFRLHRADLPGTPDLTFPRLRKAIFVHGCFWHRHGCPLAGKVPGKRQDYWLPKLRRNVERDADDQRRLIALGWEVLTIWECETRERDLSAKLTRFLGQKFKSTG
jgi:DNA mismatch endonuclease (patch repair protein)